MASFPTRFDPLIQAVTRKAEIVYSKMAIRRDESENTGKKNKEKEGSEAQSIPWEDITDVSILALKGFLEDLLGVKHNNLPPSAPLSPPQYSAASHAVDAYRHTGIAVHDHNVSPETPATLSTAPTSGITLGDDFGDEERETLRNYLRDLIELERRGTTTLQLRRSLTFLESIHQAIEHAKKV